jgi:transposase InsO family protein
MNSLSDLHKAMEQIVHDFNTIRPHGSLNGSTHDEVYSTGQVMPKNSFQTQFQQAKTIRIAENMKNACVK